jgi:hypothetical protein
VSYALFDNISVVAADDDRSVNNNSLTINGTITRTPVATGADLVAYSGFSASNYLEQPYNSDLDFGTGDFCVMGWVRLSALGSTRQYVFRDNDAASSYMHLAKSATQKFTFRAGAAGTIVNGTSTALVDGWYFIAGVVRNGTTEIWVNGALENTTTSATSLDASVNEYPLWLGKGLSAGAGEGELALIRISATAPSAEQIAKIYSDEKVLFQENAQATLYGTSDAVTALAHDSDTNLLHVGTSAGRSVFQGLRRVENTTDAVGAAISASNGLVVEE